ncbi:MAG: putative hydroxymethylpyrimidine transporter CytX [Treponema sp.]
MNENEKKGTSIFQNGLVWFGAGVSIAEILTGTYFAPLGFWNGLLAIITGHVIGGALFFLAGLIGAETKRSAMGTVQLSFGKKGALFFALLNVIQLVGWTSIMIYDGALAVNGIFNFGNWVWCVVIGLLIFAWIFFGIKDLGFINKIAMGLLFILTVVLCFVIFKNKGAVNTVAGDGISFGAAVELAVAMPLSWLPLISDYTREAKKPVGATLCSTLTYGFVSIWMYVIGMSASIFTGSGDIVEIMVKAGLGIAALVILILSTVTTTFLDALSAGISSEIISQKLNGKIVALVTAVIGTVLAIIFPMDNITDFLYFIGSVFAPMIAIQVADFFVLRFDCKESKIDVTAFVIWAVGFVLYRLLMRIDIPVGNTLPDMIIVVMITVAARKITGAVKSKK